jgi:hypothetical protein
LISTTNLRRGGKRVVVTMKTKMTRMTVEAAAAGDQTTMNTTTTITDRAAVRVGKTSSH